MLCFGTLDKLTERKRPQQPHDLDVPTWATTLQWVVNTIRSVGATSQTILLAGTE